MESAIFRVKVEHKQNKLTGHVDVIALSNSSAKMLALRVFFGRGWEVVEVTKTPFQVGS